MTNRFKKVITGAALVAVLALGAAGVANALSSNSGASSALAAAVDAASGTDDQRAAERPSADAAPADGRNCPERSGDATPEQNGDQATTTEDADV